MMSIDIAVSEINNAVSTTNSAKEVLSLGPTPVGRPPGLC
jgi:hypothetical protein